MQQISTTPFGRRPVTASLLENNAKAHAATLRPDLDKWQILRDLTAARVHFGVSDRDIAVLSALLSFHPERMLSTDGNLVVFPSNKTLGARAHGMAESTLRRHLAALVESGLILRRDSPNGKRYAARSASKTVIRAFGFDLRPLLARGAEITDAAETSRNAERHLAQQRQIASVMLRDVQKILAFRQDEVPGTVSADTLRAADDLRRNLRRKLTPPEVESVIAALDQLLKEFNDPGKNTADASKASVAAAQNERHFQDSDKDDYELPDMQQTPVFVDSRYPRTNNLTVAMVASACHSQAAYTLNDLRDWRSVLQSARQIRPMMGITREAFQDAEETMGQLPASVTVLCMLEKAKHIRSPGAYLRRLSQKARRNAFDPVAMVSALLNLDDRPIVGPS